MGDSEQSGVICGESVARQAKELRTAGMYQHP